MEERFKIQQQELGFLKKEYQRRPELLRVKRFIDSKDALETLGILIPGGDHFPVGYIGYWPQDFIVEEITRNKSVCTVYQGDETTGPISQAEATNSNLTTFATLVKCNLSSLEATAELARLLNCKIARISFAGIKDQKAITSQRIAVQNMLPTTLQNIKSPYFFLKDIAVGKGAIKIGDLWGNRFTILIRTGKNFQGDFFLKRLERVVEKGFYNYYYLQRFGLPRLINFYWGLMLLKGKYQEVVSSYLIEQSKRELPYLQLLRRRIKGNLGDWKTVRGLVELAPLDFQYEIGLVKYLERNPNDFIGALKHIRQETRLWLSAFASLLFNKRLSFYLRDKKEPPLELPLLWNNDRETLNHYSKPLRKLGIFPPPIRNITSILHPIKKKNYVKTKIRPEIHLVKIVNEGVILEFSLPKGVYATTFLAHLFRLSLPLPPHLEQLADATKQKTSADISVNVLDLKDSLGEKPLTSTLNYFEKVIG